MPRPAAWSLVFRGRLLEGWFISGPYALLLDPKDLIIEVLGLHGAVGVFWIRFSPELAWVFAVNYSSTKFAMLRIMSSSLDF